MMVSNLHKNGGYQFCHLIISFLLDLYGKDTFINWLQYPKEFVSILDEVDSSFNEYVMKEIEARIK